MKTTFTSLNDKLLVLEQYLEDILYKITKNVFFDYVLSKRINKVIFIVQDYNKEIENLGIECLKNNLKFFIFIKDSFSPENLERFISVNDKGLIVFSKMCTREKELLKEEYFFDPIVDNIIEINKINAENENSETQKEIPKIDEKFNIEIKSDNNEEIKTDAAISSQELQKKTKNAQEHFSKVGIDTTSTTDENKTMQNLEKKNKKTITLQKREEVKNPIENEIKQESTQEKSIENLAKNISPQTIEKQEIVIEKKESPKKSKEIIDLKQETQEYKPSFFTIRVKLLSIITVIIVSSLSLMIFLASFFFKRDIETRIQENNITTVDIISKKIQDLFEQIYFNSLLISQIFKEDNNTQNIDYIDNTYVLGIGKVKIVSNNLNIKNWYIHNRLLQELGLTTNDFEKTIQTHKQEIFQSLTGTYEILNISAEYNLPILLLSVPNKLIPNSLFVIFINAIKISEDISAQSLSETFILNRKGEILGSNNIDMVKTSINIKDMPIVKMMLESKFDNGLRNFNYNEKEFLGAFKKIQLGGIGIISITESQKAFEPVFTTQRRNLYILVIVAIVSIIIIYFFAKTISQPIKQLAEATVKIEHNDYSVRLKPKTRDEVGQLTYLFNKMVKGLEEREKIKDAFGRFVNKEIAEKALRGEIKLGGEKKECAVFFSDLRGFTAMSEKMKPEEIVEFLNRYFTLMVECVEKTNGVVDKFIGDAVMATWGSIISVGNDAENAVNAALMMRKVLLEFNDYNRKHNLPIAKFGCGINYGEVVAGQIGSERKLEFTVIGDTVNLASRIESLNKPFASDILISQHLYERVKDIFNVVKMPAIAVKGKSEPQVIYCVLGRKDDPTAPKNMEELRKLVGIDWEPAVKEGQDVMEDEKEEKFKILDKSKEKK